MKKKLLMIALLLIISLGGCGATGSHSAEDIDKWEDDTGYEEMDAGYEQDVHEEFEEVYTNDTSYNGTLFEEDSSENEASYIIPASYDITGKWKSVGSSGFGQAQPGAIIVFDGNNCNFYSPNDTYAFYLDGNRYVLDITSLLGESLSFSVNIVDDDNIDIAGTSLQRIN